MNQDSTYRKSSKFHLLKRLKKVNSVLTTCAQKIFLIQKERIQHEYDKDLNELRNEIRTIDKELVKLFEKRMTLCRAVGETNLIQARLSLTR